MQISFLLENPQHELNYCFKCEPPNGHNSEGETNRLISIYNQPTSSYFLLHLHSYYDRLISSDVATSDRSHARANRGGIVQGREFTRCWQAASNLLALIKL